MLQVLRNSVASIFVKILFGFLVLSFAMWGMGDIFSGGFFGNTVAEVGPLKISAQQVGNEYQRELNRLRSMNVDAEQARRMGLLDRVVQNMISRASFDAEAVERGLTASDDTIVKGIRSNPAFHGNLGSFDRIQFENLLHTHGITEEAYVGEVRQEIARNHALDSISSTIQVPKSLTDLIFSWREEERVAVLTEIPIDLLAVVPNPSAKNLQIYHKENEAKFTAPERRAVDYIHLSPGEFAKRVTVSEGELLAAFNERASEFGIPETRKLLQMVVSEEAQAFAATRRLLAGEDFALVAKDEAGQRENSIDLGEVARDDLPQDLSTTVFELAVDQVSKPIKGPFGWHIFKVKHINKGREATIEDARNRLTEELAREKSVDDIYKTANKLEDAIGGGANMAEAASDLGLKLHLVSAIDASGRGLDGKLVDGLPSAPFIETAFSSSIDEPGVLTETQDGGFFILKVKSITPAAVELLEDVKDRVARAWKNQKRAERAEELANKVASALESGRDIKDIPEVMNKDVVVTEPFTRTNGAARTRLPFSVIAEIFNFKTAGKVAVGRSGDAYVIARLLDIKPPLMIRDDGGYRELLQNLRATVSSDLLFQYNQALRSQYGASVNNALLEQLFTDNPN